MKEHPDTVKFFHFSAYVRTRSAGILRGLTPWHTDFGTKSSVLHLVRGVQAPGTHVRSDYSQTRHIGGRPSSHKANLIPQSKRQDTTATVIPCLCSFTALHTLAAELPINKKRTRTLFRKELGSSTNCMVEHQGVEPWHRSPGLSHFESLKLLDEAGFSRLSLAAEGILVTAKKARHTAICRQKSAAFCEMTLEKAFFTRAVSGCISGVVVLDVR